MTASRRGLAVPTAIAVVLALILVLSPAPGGVVASRLVVPGLVVDDVQRIVVRGAAVVELIRGDHGWTVVDPPGPADGPAVADLLSALAVARWDRVVREPDSGRGLDPARRGVDVVTRRRTIAIDIGATIAASDQVWLRVDGGADMLAPAWIAAAADRDPSSLRQRRLAPLLPSMVTGVEVHGRGVDRVLAGVPLAVHGDGWTARASAERVAALLAAITGLVAVDFPPATAEPAAGDDRLSIRVLGGTAVVELVERGACADGTVHVVGSAGAVCVDPGAWVAVATAAAGGDDATAWIDRRPLDLADTTELVLRRGGLTLRRRGGSVSLVGADRDQPTEPGAAAEVLAALSAPARRVVPAPAAGGEPVLEVRRADGGVTLLSAVATAHGPAVRRDREPFALVLAAPALAALEVGADDLRSRSLIADEASAVVRLEVVVGDRRSTIERGAVLGEWTAPAAVDRAAIDAAAAVLADLRAVRFLAPAAMGAVQVRIEVDFAPPPVAGAVGGRHVLELGARRGAGCVARVDGAVVALADTACGALAALAAR